jgi:XTP/dITP diphosphohydrolase
MSTLLIATRNRHKAEEIQAILGPRFGCLTLNDLPTAPVVHEDANTFAGNAAKKAMELANWLAASPDALLASRITDQASRILVLADDSGLEVDALNGAPGVHSARFAAPDSGQAGNSSDEENCAKLLHLLKDVPLEKRTGRFRCVLALTPVVSTQPQGASRVCYADEAELQTELFEGSCEGCVTFAPRGHNGFGYDPLFIPLGYDQTFAELGDSVKNQLSHRARALAGLKQRLESAGKASG